MRVHLTRLTGNFTQIANIAIDDETLSYGARGVLHHLLKKPDGWNVSADSLAADAQARRGKAGEGRRAMRAIFRELEEAGYLAREKRRDHRGRIVTELHLHNLPQTGTSGPGLPQESSEAGGTSVPPAETASPAGQSGVPPSGMPEPPGETGVSAGRTDVPDGATCSVTSTTTDKNTGLNDLVSRLDRTGRSVAQQSSRDKVAIVRAAAAARFKPEDMEWLTDDGALGLWNLIIAHRTPRSPFRYLRSVFRQTEYLDSLLTKIPRWAASPPGWETILSDIHLAAWSAYGQGQITDEDAALLWQAFPPPPEEDTIIHYKQVFGLCPDLGDLLAQAAHLGGARDSLEATVC